MVLPKKVALYKFETEANMKKIFIDGSKGTTGLKLSERLSHRDDIEIITLSKNILKYTTKKRHGKHNEMPCLFLFNITKH